MKKSSKRPAGFSVTELILAVALMAVMGASTVAIMYATKQKNQNMQTMDAIYLIRNTIMSSLRNKNAYAATVKDAANGTNGSGMSCLNPAYNGKYSCYNQSQQAPQLIQFNGGIENVAGPADPATKGFNINGQPCDTFGLSGTANKNCNFRYEIYWKPNCSSSLSNQGNQSDRCQHAESHFQVRLKYSAGASKALRINTDVFGFDYTTGDDSTTVVRENCAKLGGVYNTSTGQCSVFVNSSASCPLSAPGTPQTVVMIGFTSNGTPLCGQLNRTTCPSGWVVKSFDPNTGVITCQPGCNPDLSGTTNVGPVQFNYTSPGSQ